MFVLLLALSVTGGAAPRCEALIKSANSLLQTQDIAIKSTEIKKFVLENKIISAAEMQKIEDRLQVFNVNKKDMGNATLMAVLDVIGAKPSPRIDLIVDKYIRGIFLKYLHEFESFAVEKPEMPIEALFGLRFSNWNSLTAKNFIAEMRHVFSQKQNFNLVHANHLLTQLTYIHSVLSHDKKMSSEEVTQASQSYLAAIKSGHVFIPAVGMWDITNINAQWFLKVTVNMLPETLNHKVDVHGGLSALDGLTHDHGHVYNLRMASAARILGLKLKSENEARIRLFNDQLQQLIVASLKNRTQMQTEINPQLFAGLIFFFVHQPETLELFIKQLRNNRVDTIELARHMRQQLEIHQEFFPNLGKDFDGFERGARYWLTLFAETAVRSQFVRNLN